MTSFFRTLALLAIAAACSPIALAQVTIDSSVIYKIQNVNSGYVLGIEGGKQAAATPAYQTDDNGAADHVWHLIPAGNSQYRIVNGSTGQCLGISGGSSAPGAAAVQYADNGTADHLWTIVSAGSGEYKLKNVNSGLLLGISGGSRNDNTPALQWSDNGTPDHLWKLIASGGSYVGPGPVSGNVIPVADPSMVKSGSTYYLFATGNGIQERNSTDRSNFQPSNLVYAFNTIPSWTNAYSNNDLWAPDVSYHNGQYHMYYAASKFGSSNSAIGVATSTSAARGTWSDSGSPVLTSSTCSGSNAIDPGLVVDGSGKWWLSFGSFSDGINMIAIDPNTGKQLGSNHTCYSLAKRLVGSAIEGAYIYPHNGNYYLFASVDNCCQGTGSTYHVIVGRASAANGPYYDRGGVAMTQGGGTIVLATHGSIIGPGGQSIFADTDGDIFVYHYYNGNNNGYPTLGINRLGWTSDGWPYIE